jgi:transcriptional regulator with XRE-family HTH domain
VAERLGVDEFTVVNWETEQSKEPHVSVMPAILDFLGYNPFPKSITLSERLLAARRLKGWSMREAARALGIGESTWRHWERTGNIALARHRRKVDALLAELHL